MEESYKSFARVYDMFMDDINYPQWCEYLTGLLEEYGVKDGLVLELGCGTGSMTELLAKKGKFHRLIEIQGLAEKAEKGREEENF